jgi:biopolymer transport protein ExbD
VTADAASLHRTVISVIDAANEVGMQKIRMTSKKKVD